MGKVLQADELIHKQQLGWDWKPPDLEALRALARPDAATQAREEALERKRLERRKRRGRRSPVPNSRPAWSC